MNMSGKQLEMSEADFQAIASIAYQEAGLVFPPEKAPLVRSRINRRLRMLKLRSFSEYTHYIATEQGQEERRIMISALTTNVSSFFRESHHFDILRERVLPPLLKSARAGAKIRLWSAGCSTGQEPYSMAMTLLDFAPDAAELDIRILATDIDPNVIIVAKQGYYQERAVRDIPDEMVKTYMRPVQNGGQNGFLVADSLRQLVTFRELNLLAPWPMKAGFDAIFCRNVVIYFDEPTQLDLWPRFEAATKPGGWLFVGHSERLSEKLVTRFCTEGPTAYQLPLSAKPSTETE